MNKPALLLIDIQQAFNDPSWGQRNNPSADANMEKLLTLWRENNLPVIHVQHSSNNPDSTLHKSKPGFAFKVETAPIEHEKIFVKNENSAFIGTDLEAYLHEKTIESLVIIGLTTDHCVSTTTRMAGNLGFKVELISDATATFERTDKHGNYYSADEMHNINLVSLDGEFCDVLTTDEVLSSYTKN